MTEELPPPTNVIQALARIMDELPAIAKDSQASSQQGGYRYRGIEAITAVAQSLFAKYGVVFVPRVKNLEIKDIIVNSKPWTDTVLTVEYDIYGPQGVQDKIVCGPFIGIGRDNSDKGANKAITQAFKYALIQTLCISDQAADADGQSHEADAPPEPKPVDPEADKMMGKLAKIIRATEPEGEREKLASHLRGLYGPSVQMNPTQLANAIEIAEKWKPEDPEGKNDPVQLIPSEGERF